MQKYDIDLIRAAVIERKSHYYFVSKTILFETLKIAEKVSQKPYVFETLFYSAISTYAHLNFKVASQSCDVTLRGSTEKLFVFTAKI